MHEKNYTVGKGQVHWHIGLFCSFLVMFFLSFFHLAWDIWLPILLKKLKVHVQSKDLTSY